jgi:hypothetical protein
MFNGPDLQKLRLRNNEKYLFINFVIFFILFQESVSRLADFQEISGYSDFQEISGYSDFQEISGYSDFQEISGYSDFQEISGYSDLQILKISALAYSGFKKKISKLAISGSISDAHI